MNLTKLVQRANSLLGSVVFLATALAVAINEFVAQVAPELPGGWEDNAVRIGAMVAAVLGSAAAAIRRVTEVPPTARGLTLPDGVSLQVSVQDGGSTEIRSTEG